MKKCNSFLTTAAVLAISLPLFAGNSFARDHHKDNPRFEDRDREAVHGWLTEHRDHLPAGLRESNKLPPELKCHLPAGVVLDADLRHRIHPVPPDLLDRLPTCPEHYRYIAIGGHIVLMDDGFHVFDVIHFELNL